MPKKDTPELPEPVRIPCDDCTVTIAGRAYHVHRGQSVWLMGLPSIREQRAIWAFNNLAVELDNVQPPPFTTPGEEVSDEQRAKILAEALKAQRESNYQSSAIMDRAYQSLLEAMAARIVRWDWTDLNGNPRSALDGTTIPFEDLSDEEMYFLRRVLQGKVTADLPNESTTSRS